MNKENRTAMIEKEIYKEFDIPETTVKIVSYTVKIRSTDEVEKWIVKTCKEEDFLVARENAFKLAIESRDKAKTYKGIQVLLKYSETNSEGKCKNKNHKILTGCRMGTNKILQSLSFESSLLLAANKTFPQMVCNSENNAYLCVYQFFNTLYYFTC